MYTAYISMVFVARILFWKMNDQTWKLYSAFVLCLKFVLKSAEDWERYLRWEIKLQFWGCKAEQISPLDHSTAVALFLFFTDRIKDFPQL